MKVLISANHITNCNSHRQAQRLTPASVSAQSTPQHTGDLSSASEDLNGNPDSGNHDNRDAPRRSPESGRNHGNRGSPRNHGNQDADPIHEDGREALLGNQDTLGGSHGNQDATLGCNYGNQETPLARSPLSVHDSESVLTNGNAPASWCDEDLSLMSQTSSTSGKQYVWYYLLYINISA